ncbi:MAG: flagellar M-ring protein FliF [Alphaproteobacteria bacterium]|nr:flagellar M-ring protein FliF [Alphaproteobacteria bacterium]
MPRPVPAAGGLWRVPDFVRSLLGWRLAAIAGVTLAAAGLLFYLATQATKTPMGLLFTGLDARDSAAVVERLEAGNVTYELRGDGSTILVPEDRVLRLRMDLAGGGLPAGGGVGYEIFDNQDALGVTSFQQNVNRLRALEGELSRTIRALDRIDQARVHLVIPERKLFSETGAEPTASIVIRARGGRIAPEQVQAIQHLVASAVEGLTPQRVSVVDEKGELLAGGEGDQSAAAAQSALAERQAAFEERVRRQVEGIVASVAGPGHARVEVTADLDFNRRTKESTTYNPDGQVVRSTQTRSSNADASNKQAADAVSAGTQLPDAQNAGQGAGDQSRETNAQTDETVNYEISSVKEVETQEGGGVKRLSVAVAVDGVWTTSGEGAKSYQPRSDDDMKKIEQLVRSTIGFDEKRGDTLQVVNVQFAQEDAQDLGPAVDDSFLGLGLTKSDIMQLVELGVLAIIALLAIFLVFRPLMNKLLSPITFAGNPQLAGPGGAALPAPGAGALTGGESATAALPAPQSNADRMIDIAQVDGQVSASSVKKVGEIVQRHPEEAVSIMRQWLHEAS